jgi:DNA-directed RNA polymerase subunit L
MYCMRRFNKQRSFAQSIDMPVKVLQKDKNELRLRISGESHTALQVLRERLNTHKDVEYANYFPGHPELDDPEFYIRTTAKGSADKVLQDIISNVIDDFKLQL